MGSLVVILASFEEYREMDIVTLLAIAAYLIAPTANTLFLLHLIDAFFTLLSG